MKTRLPSDRHIRAWVWSSHGAHHWHVRVGRASAGGNVGDREQAWACAMSAVLGALRIRELEDAAAGRESDLH